MSENVPAKPNPARRKSVNALNPFSPVPIQGADALYGYGRIAAYGGLAFAFRKVKPIRNVLILATGISIATSLSGDWRK